MTAMEVLAPFVDSYAMLLRTRKRDGTWVATPVNVVVEGDHAFFRTYERSGKAKRIRNFPDVSVAPCTLRGRPTGSFVAARATLLRGDRDEHASTAHRAEVPDPPGCARAVGTSAATAAHAALRAQCRQDCRRRRRRRSRFSGGR